MIASELISNVVPVLKPEDTCLQALNWMELFRVSHLPMEQGKMYLGLVDDEMIYAHGDLNDRLDVLQIPVEGTFMKIIIFMMLSVWRPEVCCRWYPYSTGKIILSVRLL